MEKILDTAIGLIEAIAITGAIGFFGAMGFRALHDEVRKETIEALKRPTPSLCDFSRKLTMPSR